MCTGLGGEVRLTPATKSLTIRAMLCLALHQQAACCHMEIDNARKTDVQIEIAERVEERQQEEE